MGRAGRYFRTAANALLIISLVLAGLLAALFLPANRPAGGGRAEDIPGIGRYKVLVVLSDSMRPAFAAGDLVVIDTAAPEDEIKRGDIIAFRGSVFFMLVILPAVLAFLLEVKLLKRKDLKERLPWLERS
ncbi:MAG: S24/S26 family peptidase [Bacillota bacterium]